MCFPSGDIGIKDFNLILSYWTAPRTPKDNDLWNVFPGLGRRVVNIRPDPYGSIRVMMNRMPENESAKEVWRKASRQDKATQKALVKKEFADLGWEANRVLESLDDAEDFYFQNIQQIRMKKWSIGRVVCIGDAAHAPTPLTAMGASLGKRKIDEEKVRIVLFFLFSCLSDSVISLSLFLHSGISFVSHHWSIHSSSRAEQTQRWRISFCRF